MGVTVGIECKPVLEYIRVELVGMYQCYNMVGVDWKIMKFWYSVYMINRIMFLDMNKIWKFGVM